MNKFVINFIDKLYTFSLHKLPLMISKINFVLISTECNFAFILDSIHCGS